VLATFFTVGLHPYTSEVGTNCGLNCDYKTSVLAVQPLTESRPNANPQHESYKLREALADSDRLGL